jgi:hypothetical protein
VPTTTVFSSTDQIVSPQTGFNASGYLRDHRNVGVTNVEVQFFCDGRAAGGNVTHEGVLYNSLGFELAVDALTHRGTAEVRRLEPYINRICGQEVAPGLNALDVAETEGQCSNVERVEIPFC